MKRHMKTPNAAKPQHPSDYIGRVNVTDRITPVNANVGATIRFHKGAKRAVELKQSKKRWLDKNEKAFATLCAIEWNARHAIALATPRNLKEAVERLLYLEKVWRKIGDGENAWPILSMCIQSLEYHAA